MVSGTRRLNYTRRQRIKHQHAIITLREGPASVDAFDMTLDLATYSLPPEARVFIEAYRTSAFQRFDCGTVGTLQLPENRDLSDFDGSDGTLFRVKVVEPEGSKVAARILAQADGIRPNRAGKRRSLLDVRPGDFRDEVWRLEIDEGAGPAILVSKYHTKDRHSLVRSEPFVSLVLPQILERILTEALKGDGPDFEDDPNHWAVKWALLACGLLGQTELPPEVLEDVDAREEWIHSAVGAFCRIHNVGRQFSHFYGGE